MVTDGRHPAHRERPPAARQPRHLEGKIASLRHFKNDVSEVRQGFECGIGIERFQDIKVGDVIEAFKTSRSSRPALGSKRLHGSYRPSRFFELHIEYAQSLKDKRTVVKSLRDRLRHHFHISANEVALPRRASARPAGDLVRAPTGTTRQTHCSIESSSSSSRTANAVLAGWTSEKLDFDEEADLT